MKKKISWFDHLIYQIFFWRWQSIFANRPDLRELFIAHLKAFDVCDEGTKVKVSVSISEYQDELDN